MRALEHACQEKKHIKPISEVLQLQAPRRAKIQVRPLKDTNGMSLQRKASMLKSKPLMVLALAAAAKSFPLLEPSRARKSLCSANAKVHDAEHAYACVDDDGRRDLILSSASAALSAGLASLMPVSAHAAAPSDLRLITDPNTYSALAYAPPIPAAADTQQQQKQKPPPLLLVLPGAAQNKGTAWDLADMNGEHRGLPSALLAAGVAPETLAQHFAVVTPYPGRNVQSFYDEPRSKVLGFVQWLCDQRGENGVPRFDPNQIFLLGFSDGATLSIELLTTGRFRGGIVAAYGFTGTLPQLALDRLKGKPIWVFHSADDVIFPVACSDRLVESLRKVNDEAEGSDLIRYSRFDSDQEGFTGRVRGHSTGITASKRADVYDWLLSYV